MDLRAVAKRMADYNEWRRGSYDVPPPEPRQIGLDIDCAVAALQFAGARTGRDAGGRGFEFIEGRRLKWVRLIVNVQ